MKQKNIFRESNVWPHVSLMQIWDLHFLVRKFRIIVYKHCQTVHSAYEFQLILLFP
jgi:hypothetical protein